jgi:hypothetical protein
MPEPGPYLTDVPATALPPQVTVTPFPSLMGFPPYRTFTLPARLVTTLMEPDALWAGTPIETAPPWIGRALTTLPGAPLGKARKQTAGCVWSARAVTVPPSAA